jgi:hypothetical protein
VGWRTTERLDETVVSASAAQCVLGGVERAALKFERRVPVVVEAAHQRLVDRERDADCGETRLNTFEVRGGGGAVELGNARCCSDDLGIPGPFRIEHSQCVLVERDPAVG